ncbi:MAG: DUF2059 domain-containing protein [Pseudolabrys sp.]|nr:DUF2059 domain-containing protein [Pseudolabrys sp.]
MRLLPSALRVSRLAIIAATMILSAPAAYAQNQSPAALLTAAQIVKVTGAANLFNPLVAGVVEQAKNLFLQQDPGLGGDLNEVAAKMRADLEPRLSELTGEVARIYATHFSEEELKELLAFYNSPVGKKLVQEQPNIVNDSLKFAQDWANTLSDEVVKKMRAELQKKGHKL